MNVLILTVGSRGDVQPFVALGLGLQAAGYRVKLAAPALFEGFVREYGLDFAPINDDALNLKDTPAGQAALSGKRGSSLSLIKQVMPMMRRMLDDEWTAAQGAEALIYHPKSMGGTHLSEKLNIPAIMSMPLPLYSPTGAFPMPIMPAWKLGGGYNRLTYNLLRLIGAPYGGLINKWRNSIGLPPRARFASELIRHDGSTMPVLYSYSPQVLAPPIDWNADTHVTGYWMLDEHSNWKPSNELLRFLDAGKPPVYIGFGSMTGANPEEKARIVVEALTKTGQRGIIAKGWGGLKASDLPAHVFMIDEVPHSWLFARVAAVVHHGGAGTTAAGLMAGKPTLICPFIADQPFWGRRLHELGVGTAPIPQGKLTTENLATAVHVIVSDAEMQRKAAALGEKLRAENGIGNAVALVEQYFGIPERVAVGD